MPRKRKQATLPSSVRKRPKQAAPGLMLDDLPLDVLDTILEYSLDDPRDFRWLLDPYNSRTIFLQPVLQTCRMLRQRCFTILATKRVWLTMKFPIYIALERHIVEKLPFAPIPADLWELISDAAPRLDMVSEDTRGPEAWEDRTLGANLDTIVLPFNFVVLAWFFEMANHISIETAIDNFRVAGSNLHGSLKSEVVMLILSAISLLRDVLKVHLTINGENVPIECREGPDFYDGLDKLTQQTTEILDAAKGLKESGYVDESSTLLVMSSWPGDEAGSWLVYPSDWDMGEIDDTRPLDDDSEEMYFGARCARGNRLRQLVFQLELQACHAYTHLNQTYGTTWYQLYDDALSNPWRPSLGEHECTYFGVPTQQLAELHFAHARIFETVATVAEEKKAHYLQEALIEIDFARLLDKKNLRYREARKACAAHLFGLQNWDHKYERLCNTEAQRRFVLIEDETDTAEQKRIVWAGDWNMISGFGGQKAASEWLPLAQKGIDIPVSFNEWLAENLTEKQREKFVKQGRRWVERANFCVRY